jgi:hypothetical protein
VGNSIQSDRLASAGSKNQSLRLMPLASSAIWFAILRKPEAPDWLIAKNMAKPITERNDMLPLTTVKYRQYKVTNAAITDTVSEV